VHVPTLFDPSCCKDEKKKKKKKRKEETAEENKRRKKEAVAVLKRKEIKQMQEKNSRRRSWPLILHRAQPWACSISTPHLTAARAQSPKLLLLTAAATTPRCQLLPPRPLASIAAPPIHCHA
jgi:hypothetical protein